MASRVAVLAAALVAATMYPKLRVVQSMGSLWDGRWYLEIARHGYPHQLVNEGDGSRWAFFPAFPTAVRALSEVTRLSLPDAAFAVAFVFGLTAALAIWLAVREVSGSRLADRARAAPRLLPDGLRPVHGVHRGSLPHGGGGLPLRPVAPLLAHGGPVRVPRRSHPQHGGRGRAGRGRDRAPAAWRGRTLRPAVAAAGPRSGSCPSWPTAGPWSGRRWPSSPPSASGTTSTSSGSSRRSRRLLGAMVQGPGGMTFVPDAMAGAALVLGFVGIWLLDRMGRPETPRGAT